MHSGQDPRDFVVFSLGGAGPLHAAGYADAGDVRRVATFPFSSVFGAFSTLTLDVLQTYERTLNARLYATRSGLTAATVPVINEAIAELLQQADRDMREEGFDMAAIRFEIEGALSYGQQRQTLAVKLHKYPIADLDDVGQICTDFNNAYRDKFGEGSGYPDAGIELVEVRINAVAPASKFVLQPVAPDTGTETLLPVRVPPIGDPISEWWKRRSTGATPWEPAWSCPAPFSANPKIRSSLRRRVGNSASTVSA